MSTDIISCPNCQRKLRVPENLVGQQVQCPTCGKTFTATLGDPTLLPEEEEGIAPPRKQFPSRPVRERSEEEGPDRWRSARREDYRRRPPEEDDDDFRARRGWSGSAAAAQSKVSGPAAALTVAMGIGIALALCGVVMNLAGVGLGAAGAPQGGRVGQEEAMLNLFSGVAGIISSLVGIVVGIVVIMGAQKMKNLESYGFAMTSSILAMIPCLSPCCILGLPFGIWAVVVLNDPEVKAYFRS